jgi:hypothetical protein
MGLGIEELLERVRGDPNTTLEAWTALRSALARLLDPAVTGRFAVLAYGRGIDPEPPLRGFDFRLPARGR